MSRNKKPVIVISGEPGAGSSTISQAVAEKLGLDYLSPGKFLKGNSKKSKEVESKAAISVLKTDRGSSESFHNDLDRQQTEAAKKGGVVICGKLSIHFLKKYADFCVWLDVPREERARRTAGRDKIGYEEALASISEREEIDRKNFLRIYGFDYHKQKKEADLVLDTSRMTIEQAVNSILSALKKKVQ